MKKQMHVLIFLLIAAVLFYAVQSSYAIYQSSVDGEINNVSFAKFVFEGELTDTLSFDIEDMLPGDTKTFSFTVSNVNSSSTATDVTIKYRVSVDSLEVLPLTYSLTLGNDTTNLLSCSGGDYLCETSDILLTYNDNVTRTYTLTITFPTLDSNNNPWGIEYANRIEAINLRIYSWQVTS